MLGYIHEYAQTKIQGTTNQKLIFIFKQALVNRCLQKIHPVKRRVEEQSQRAA